MALVESELKADEVGKVVGGYWEWRWSQYSMKLEKIGWSGGELGNLGKVEECRTINNLDEKMP